VPTAAAPAARAAFLATCLTFGRSVFFVVLRLFVLFAFLVFDVVRARFNEDLAFVRLTLFFMILPPHNERPVAGPNLNTSGVPDFHLYPAVITVFFCPILPPPASGPTRRDGPQRQPACPIIAMGSSRSRPCSGCHPARSTSPRREYGRTRAACNEIRCAQLGSALAGKPADQDRIADRHLGDRLWRAVR
jgi:hypothetical protein